MKPLPGKTAERNVASSPRRRRAGLLAQLSEAAPSPAGRTTGLAALLATAGLVLFLVLAPTAQAGKVLGFGELGTGTTGPGEGQLRGTQGVAVNTTGAGGATAGDVYVSEGTNHRISVFSSTGVFKRMFGRNVVASGPDNNPTGEVQNLDIVADEGTFSLKFGSRTTGALPYNAPASGGTGATASVQNALEALSTIGSGDVTVTGGPGGTAPYQVTFGGTLAGENVDQLTVNTSGLGIPVGTQLTCAGGPSTTNGFEFQWFANGESLGSANGARTAAYTVQPEDVGKVIQCQVLAESTSAFSRELIGRQTSSPSTALENVASPYPATPPPTTAQTALAAPSGRTIVGEKLTCSPGAWTGSPTFTYQWYRQGVPLVGNGANTNQYTLQPEDVPNFQNKSAYQCEVKATNAGGAVTLLSRMKVGPSFGGDAGITASVPPPSMTTTVEEGGGPEICVAGVDTCQAGESQVDAGSVSPLGLAIDPATGNVFIASDANERVDVFSATGEYEGSFGWAVDASRPEEKLQFCTAATGCQAGSSGAGPGQLGTLTGSGGQGSQPAVSPIDGHLFVPEPGNRRVSEFSFTLNGANEVDGVAFVKAFGGDVVPTIDEEQTVTLGGATGGSFSLTFESQTTGATGTGDLKAGSNEVREFEPSAGSKFVVGEELSAPGIPAGAKITAVSFDSLTLTVAATEDKTAASVSASLPFDATAATVEGALEALSSIGKGNATVSGASGGPWTVDFTGALAGVDQPQMSGDASRLAGTTPTVEIATVRAGANGVATGLESCTQGTGCQAGTGDGTRGTFVASSPASVAVDSTGSIYVTGQAQGNVQKLDPNATSAEEFGPAHLTLPEGGNTTAAGVRSVSVDPGDDHILVVRKASSSTFKIVELTRAGAFIDAVPAGELGFPANGGVGSFGPQGLAVGTGGRAYLVRPDSGAIPPGAILGNPPAPSAAIDPASDIGRTSVSLNGVAVPSAPGPEGGFSTVAYFEYSTDGISWTASEAVELGDGTGAGDPNACPTGNPPSCNVSLTLSGLVPGTSYLARLVANNGTAAASSTISFTTGEGAPTISDLNPNPVEATTANLNATINPNGRSTSYRFEWGTDPSYGHRTPAEFDPVIGSGSKPVPVSGHLSGLEPGTAYHYRVVASSSAGTTASPDHELVTLNAEGLPADRHAELVSPAEKRPVGGVMSILEQPTFQTSEDGEKIGYPILNGLADSDSGGQLMYAATRTASGWSSAIVTPPSLVVPPNEGPPSVLGAEASHFEGFNDNLSCALVATQSPLTDDTPAAAVEAGMTFLYRWNAVDGSYTLISNRIPPDPAATRAGTYGVVGATSDCSKVFFTTTTYSFIAGATGVYEWDQGVLRDALSLPDGTTPSDGDAASLQDVAATHYRLAPDGRFFFTARSDQGADSGRQAVFVRKGPGDVVDTTQPTTTTPTLGAQYIAASPDGSKVFFAANYGLASTSSAGPTESCTAVIADADRACDLYRYDVDSGQLIDVSADPNPEDPKGAVLQGALDASADGSTVYFAARGQLIPGEGRTYAQNARGGFANVYRWHEGDPLAFVGSLARAEIAPLNNPQGTAMIQTGTNPGVRWNAQTTRDGKYLLFVSSDDIGGTNPDHVAAAYLYSAATGQTECVSCGAAGIAKAPGNPRMIAEAVTGNSFTPTSLSEDGRVIFTSERALAPGAIEGKGTAALENADQSEYNVYEWHQGQVSLLATGHVRFGNSAGPGGRGVFITSYERLAPQDVDFAPDLFDLRIGGGFPQSTPPPPPCDPAADQCQGAPSNPPIPPTPATTGATGGGNAPSPAKGRHHKRKHHKRKHHHRKHRKTKHRNGTHRKKKLQKRKSRANQAKRGAKNNHGGAK